ncbi:glycosyltransferase [uncultured Pontibacter sp.]|uniref:glycosyltransferase n=1 Tax=uncultured Pontibacter sp. TaxID=453356 RepID=UPI0026315942|nr:glycosyltransferase [uncultured Pontibacter sp.]
MKILYIISTFKGGNGGHAYSLTHISSEISKYADTAIISIGPKRSKVVTTSPHYLQYLYFDAINILTFKNELYEVLETYKPDIIHCFDTNAYNIVKLILPNSKYKIILNKCGGPNKKNYPLFNDLILFSIENKTWFDQQFEYNKSNIHLIPNRVKGIKVAAPSQLDEPIFKDQTKFTFVRIARLGAAYKKGIIDAIRLISILTNLNYKVELYIIGVIENELILRELQKEAQGLNVIFLTKDVHTVKASKMLYLADAVVATGRGLMEACSIGLPVLTPSINANIPVLVSENNFDSFLSTNFSERNVDEGYSKENNISNIIKLINNKEYNQKLRAFTSEMFEKYFDISEGAKKYIEVYKSVLTSNRQEVSRFKNIPSKLKTLYGFYKYSRK